MTLSKLSCSIGRILLLWGGHSGRGATLKKLKQLFYWEGMHKSVQNFLRQCTVCQACKYDKSANPSLLQTLPIPQEVWVEISMDFVEGLHKSQGKDVIWVVVDRLSKYAHLMALSHPYCAEIMEQSYLDNIFKLHGLPGSIVSDGDAIFLSSLWQSIVLSTGVELLLSSAYHPQMDG